MDWLETAPEYKCNPDMPFADIMVPTPDTVRYTFVMRNLILSGHHVLAVGGTGTGKTLAVQVCFPSGFEVPSRAEIGQNQNFPTPLSLLTNSPVCACMQPCGLPGPFLTSHLVAMPLELLGSALLFWIESELLLVRGAPREMRVM